MNIYRLKYTDKAEALTDLIAKGVLVDDAENSGVYNFGVGTLIGYGLSYIVKRNYNNKFNK